MMREFYSTSADETRSIAHHFALQLRRGDVVALYGELGTGKTQFVKGICDAFSAKSVVTSPTFILCQRYEGWYTDGKPLFIYHLDLYRINSPFELYDIGYEEILYGQGISCIEWAERCDDLLPRHRYDVTLSFGKCESDRFIRITESEK